MADATPIRCNANGETWAVDDIVVDATGQWVRHSVVDDCWLLFGTDIYMYDHELVEPLTLVVRAGETTDLLRARQAAMALEAENAELRQAMKRAIAGQRPSGAEDDIIRESGRWPHLTPQWERILRAALTRVDPLRGGE